MAKTKEVADRIGVTTATIRNWTGVNGPYYRFVSESAQGGHGARDFTDRDMRIMAAVKDLSDEHLSPDDIVANLERMQAANWIELPPLPALPGYDNEYPTVPEGTAKLAVERMRDVLTVQIQTLESQIGRLEDQLQVAHGERQELQAALQEKTHELGEAQGQLLMLERESARGRRVLVAVAVGIALVALVLLVAVLIMALGGA